MKKIFLIAMAVLVGFLAHGESSTEASLPQSSEFQGFNISSPTKGSLLVDWIASGQKLPYGFDRALYLKRDNVERTCGLTSVILESVKSDPKALEAALDKVKWDPCCIPQDMRRILDRKRGQSDQVVGYSFGTTASFTLGVVDGNVAREAVLLFNADKSLQFTVVTAYGASKDVGLPAGVGVTYNLLQGQCYDISHYLGLFVTGELGPAAKNYGVTASGERTYCDSSSLVLGLDTSIFGIEISNYFKSSKTYQISGPRVQNFIKYMNASKSQDLKCKGDL